MEIRNKNYFKSIILLNTILTELNEKQQAQLSSFFPEAFSNYTLKKNPYHLGDDLTQTQSLQVLSTKQFISSNDETVDVNLVFDDPSIKEFIRIIETPSLVSNLENTQVVTFANKYKGLEKYFDIEKYYECNIILNNQTLLNIVANGVEDRSFINEFLEQVNLEKIDKFISLKNQ